MSCDRNAKPIKRISGHNFWGGVIKYNRENRGGGVDNVYKYLLYVFKRPTNFKLYYTKIKKKTRKADNL